MAPNRGKSDRLLRKLLQKRKARRERQLRAPEQGEAAVPIDAAGEPEFAALLDDPLLQAVDAWRAAQPTKMTLDQATRELVQRGLKTDRPSLDVSPLERLAPVGINVRSLLRRLRDTFYKMRDR
jgi:hypothetical protein